MISSTNRKGGRWGMSCSMDSMEIGWTDAPRENARSARSGGRGRGGNGRGAFLGEEVFINVVGRDHAIIDGAKPARHDDADRARVVEARKMGGKIHRHFQAFELRAERGALPVARIMLDRARRGGLRPIALGAHLGNESLQAGDRFVDETLLLPLVVFVRQLVPVLVA